ncbi:MAG: aminotransferase class V-fold PLP-dependent enzyme [Clostridia bacterium]|nr:aminotransferase class V-fold PLP-dependent enzyme [Lachnospiraceae bacterium]NCB99906.1 aminotransferase class V-fold PLP-dependent enzyme [Clostridia bacterium]NCD03069.1 aminotransferase class V-fold PLP-dependent enzyme [Clostridia bacterium]
MIYLDSSATSFYRPPQVGEAVSRAINSIGNASRGVHEASLIGGRIVFETRQSLAELFHAEGPEQVAFTANATESLNMAIKGILNPGDRAVTTVMEHNSVLRPLYEMEKVGVSLQIIGTDASGRLDMASLEKAIGSGIKALFCTHASNLTGNVNDIRRIGRWCREKKVLFVVDASQTAGIFPIDMEKDCIDILCFTGHKGLMGPQGTGGICLGKGISIRPLVTGGSGIHTFDKEHPSCMPEALEAGTLNGHGIAGLKAAIEYILDTGIELIREKEQKLAKAFYEQVREIPGIRIYGDFSDENRVAIVSLNLGDEDSGEVSDWLSQNYNICTRAGGHCAPLMHKAFGTVEQGMVRFSFSGFNSMEDVSAAVNALKEF